MNIHTESIEPQRPVIAPASLHPGVIDRHFLRDPYTRERVSDPALEAIESAMAFAHRQCADTVIAHEKILSNQMETCMKRAQQAAALVDRNFDESTKRLQVAFDKINTETAEIEKKTQGPKPASSIPEQMLDAEIRGALSGMSPEKRKEAINASIANGDDSAMRALIGGPPLLTGVLPAELEIYLQTWRQKRFPAELDRLKRIRKAQDDLDRGTDSLFGFRNRMTPNREAIGKAEASERAANEVLKKTVV